MSNNPQHSQRVARAGVGTGLRLAYVWGIEIRLDLSVAIIFGLVVYSLGVGVFPHWHPDWSAPLRWGTALVAGLLFFASLLAHELAHSVVAQIRGIRVPRITLFVFGGVSEMEREPDTPVTEFLIAIVGPMTSFLLGAFFTSFGLSLAGESVAAQLVDNPEAALSSVGPAATLLLWLGPVNLVLGVFNLVPGFPLDGGRVFRSVLWWTTGDLERATEWAANAGRGFAYFLMAFGVFQAIAGGLLQGLWLLLIGWFLNNAARASHAQLLLRQTLELLRVSDLMRTRFNVVQADLPLGRFIEDYLLRSAQSAWPVLHGDRAVGLITFDDVRATSEDARDKLTVGHAMGSIDRSLPPGLGGREALQILLRSETDPLPVIENGQVVGLLHRADIMRWLALHQLKANTD